MQRWIKSRTRLAHSWIRPAKVMSFCAVKSKRSSLHISEQADFIETPVVGIATRIIDEEN